LLHRFGFEGSSTRSLIAKGPAALTATSIGQVEFNLRKHENQGRSIFRVCNISAARYLGGDIVCLVPPSFSDKRRDRTLVKARSLAA